MGPMMAKLLGLFSHLALEEAQACFAAPREDAHVLLQWGLRVSPFVVSAGPAEGEGAVERGDARPAAAPPRPQDVVLDFFGVNPQGENATEGPTSGNVDLGDAMKSMAGFSEAVRSDEFMGNMTEMYKSVQNHVKDSVKRTEAALDKFVFYSKTAREKEMPALAVYFFNNASNESELLVHSLQEESQRIVQNVPANYGDMVRASMMQPSMDSLTGQGSSGNYSDVQLLFPANASAEEICSLVDARLLNYSHNAHLQSKDRQLVNDFKSRTLEMKEYITSVRPDIAPRVIHLVDLMTETTYAAMTDELRLTNAIMAEAAPVLKARFRCRLQLSRAPRPGAGGGLLVAAAALAALGLRP